MNNTIDLKLYDTFHTVLRNIGLYTSISLAILGSSRFYIGKNVFILNHFFLLLLSFIFIFYSLLINIFFIKDLYNDLKKNKVFIKWIYLLKSILVFNTLLLLYIIYMVLHFF